MFDVRPGVNTFPDEGSFASFDAEVYKTRDLLRDGVLQTLLCELIGNYAIDC